jgi:hypothetical protein
MSKFRARSAEMRASRLLSLAMIGSYLSVMLLAKVADGSAKTMACDILCVIGRKGRRPVLTEAADHDDYRRHEICTAERQGI